MSGFQFRAPHEQDAAGRRNDRRRDEGRGRGRGRDPNAEPLPASSAQPLTRAELAYQRQIEAQNSLSVTGRAFGGQLTADPTPSQAFAARPPPSTSEPATVTASRPTTTSANNLANSVRNLNLQAPAANPTPQTPQEQARLLRHNAVTERASNMLRNDQTKLQEFRSQISAYRNSNLSAAQLIESFFALFDSDANELGKLVKELAEIFEIETKRQGLLKAWSDWKAINEDYPSLPGSATEQALSGATTAHGGSRVLKLKSSTARSSRSTANQQASWSSASSSNPFPALPAATSANRIGAKPGQTPWTSSSSTNARASPLPSRTASSTGLSNKAPKANLADGFPALPAAPKPTSTIFSPGYTGAGLRRDNSGRNTPVGNAWNTGGGGSGSTTPAVEDASGGKKKGNKNKKQTLFHFG